MARTGTIFLFQLPIPAGLPAPLSPMAFADNLKALPPATHLSSIQLFDGRGQHVSTLENKPGQSGSVAVYAALAQRFGSLTPAAAEQGLAWYAEHTEDARQHPGKHPNIDRLISIAGGETGPFLVKLLMAG